MRVIAMTHASTDRASDECRRCGGLTVVENLCGGAQGSVGWDLTVQRCVMCGDAVDPLILENQARTAAKRVPDNSPGLAEEPSPLTSREEQES